MWATIGFYKTYWESKKGETCKNKILLFFQLDSIRDFDSDFDTYFVKSSIWEMVNIFNVWDITLPGYSHEISNAYHFGFE